MNPIQYTLENGMKVILQPSTTAPVVACNVWVGVGSADEEDYEAGLAHVHEHMLFKGTEKRGVGDIARDVEAAGGHINAFTSFDQTCYYVVLSSRFFENSLDILSDAIRNSSFDADELARELEVIQEEIKRGEDSPGQVVSKRLFETAFVEHPYRLPVIGTSESVDSFDRDAVTSFFKKHYVPKNMVLVLAGDFEVNEARQLVEKYFGDFTGPDYQPRPRQQEPKQTAPRAWSGTRDVRQNRLRLGFHIPQASHEDIPALDLLSIILGYGDASHLERTILREGELVSSVFASAYSPKEPGLFVIGTDFQLDEARPEVTPEHILGRLMEEVFRFRHVRPGTGDIDRARTLLESQAIYDKQTVEGLAMKLGHFAMVTGNPTFDEEYYRALAQVDAEQIRAVAHRYLTVENCTIALLQPESERRVASEALIDSLQKAYATAETEAIGNGFELDEAGCLRLEIPHGPTLIVQEDKSVEAFSIRSLTLGGSRFESPDEAGIYRLLSQLVVSGTPSRSALEIASETESMAAFLGGIGGRNSFGLAMTGLTRFFDRCMDIFAECALTSTIPDEEFSRERRLQIDQLRARKDSLGAVNLDQFTRAFFGDHPYALPTLGTEESLQALTAEAVRERFNRQQNPSQMVLSIVGDVDVEQVVNHVERYFVRSDAPEPFEPTIPAVPTIQEPTLVLDDLEKEQAHIIAGFPAPLLAEEDNFAIQLLAAVLSGQGGRLFYELRDRQSLAYSIFASQLPGLDASAFTIHIGTSPEKIEQAVNGIRTEIEKLRADFIPEEEIERARRYLIGNHDIGLQQNSVRAMSFALDELYGFDYQRAFSFGDHIAAVTSDDIRRVLMTYLDPERMLVSIVKPSATEVDAARLGLKLLG